MHDRKFELPNAKMTRYIALVTITTTLGANTWRKVERTVRPRDDGINKETTGEDAGLQNQLSKKNRVNEES